MKTKKYIAWDQYFMGIAKISALRSKDPNTKVGCCIVNRDNKIVGVGYNGMPIGCDDHDFPWVRNSSSKLNEKYMYVVHSEINAILNRNSSHLENCKLYVTLFPCHECAKVIIQSGIREVIYEQNLYKNSESTIAAMRMFKYANVKMTKYKNLNSSINIKV